VPAESKCA